MSFVLEHTVKNKGLNRHSINTNFFSDYFILHTKHIGAELDRQQIMEGNGLKNRRTSGNDIGTNLQLTINAGVGTALQLNLIITQ